MAIGSKELRSAFEKYPDYKFLVFDIRNSESEEVQESGLIIDHTYNIIALVTPHIVDTMMISKNLTRIDVEEIGIGGKK